jgi:hypothetical protein
VWLRASVPLRYFKGIEPQWAPGLPATHTLNMADDLAVIDGCKRRCKFW